MPTALFKEAKTQRAFAISEGAVAEWILPHVIKRAGTKRVD